MSDSHRLFSPATVSEEMRERMYWANDISYRGSQGELAGIKQRKNFYKLLTAYAMNNKPNINYGSIFKTIPVDRFLSIDMSLGNLERGMLQFKNQPDAINHAYNELAYLFSSDPLQLDTHVITVLTKLQNNQFANVAPLVETTNANPTAFNSQLSAFAANYPDIQQYLQDVEENPEEKAELQTLVNTLFEIKRLTRTPYKKEFAFKQAMACLDNIEKTNHLKTACLILHSMKDFLQHANTYNFRFTTSDHADYWPLLCHRVGYKVSCLAYELDENEEGKLWNTFESIMKSPLLDHPDYKTTITPAVRAEK